MTEQPNGFRLDAITLRGVGPYIDGARLNIRPLTILCGTNGSGKSTWIKALRLLKQSVKNPAFPFKFAGSDDDLRWYTNALMRDFPEEMVSHARSKAQDEFGPPGTISLCFTAIRDVVLGSIGNEAVADSGHDDRMKNFAYHGICSKGTRFEFRIAHPRLALQDDVDGIQHLVELLIDGDTACRFTRDLDEEWLEYNVELSNNLLPVERQELRNSLINAGAMTYRVTNEECNYDLRKCGLYGQLSAHVIMNIKAIVEDVLNSTFPIGAIRSVDRRHTNLVIDEDAGEVSYRPVKSRYVGYGGRRTWDLESAYCLNEMRQSSDYRKRVDRDDVPLPLNFNFECYASYWLHKLVNVKIMPDSEGSVPSYSDSWRDHGEPPIGYLATLTPAITSPLAVWNDINAGKFDRFMHSCFDMKVSDAMPESPLLLSSGFHQVAPIVVQCALVLPHELVTIENPEVHLHPSLQLSLTEYLIREAKSGKRLLIETHSDLVVRRLMRAVLDEFLPQEDAAIYFVDLHKRDDLFNIHESRIIRIEIDERGRIANWPPGFMDDDIRETRRLMQATYGSPEVIDDSEPGD